MINRELNLKKLVETTPWSEVWVELLRNYQHVKKQKPGYQEVFEKLQLIEIIESDLVLGIKPYDEDGNKGVDIAAYNDECPAGYSMTFSPWGEWLGLPIFHKTLEELSHAEILAHCLYRMTWMGGSDEDVQESAKELKEKLDAYFDDM